MSEKNVEEMGLGGEKGVYDVEARQSASRRRSSVVGPEVLAGEIFDERYERTQRGLKSRHAQMIALGGTIGTGRE